MTVESRVNALATAVGADVGLLNESLLKVQRVGHGDTITEPVGSFKQVILDTGTDTSGLPTGTFGDYTGVYAEITMAAFTRADVVYEFLNARGDQLPVNILGDFIQDGVANSGTRAVFLKGNSPGLEVVSKETSTGVFDGEVTPVIPMLPADRINLDDYSGIDKSGVTSSQTAFMLAASDASAAGLPLVINGGKYRFDTFDNLTLGNAHWIAANSPEFIFENQAELRLNGQAAIFKTQTHDVSRLDTTIRSNAGVDLEVGDYINVGNGTVAETGFNYTKTGLYKVVAISGDEAKVDRPFRFSFGASETGAYFSVIKKGNSLKIDGSLAVTKEGTVTFGRTDALSLNRYSCVDIEKLVCAGEGKHGTNGVADYQSALRFYASTYIRIGSVEATDISYPVLAGQGTYDMIVGRRGGVHLLNCRHSIEASQFAEKIYIYHLSSSGSDGAVSAHAAFDVHFIGSRDYCKDTPFNFRAIGGSIRYATLSIDSSAALFGPYIAQIQFTDLTIFDDLLELGLKQNFHYISINDMRVGTASGNGTTFAPRGGYNSMRTIDVIGPDSRIGSIDPAGELKRTDFTDCYLKGDRVNPEIGVILAQAPEPVADLSINTQTGTTYTTVLSDGDDTIIAMNNAAANTVTIPSNANTAYPIGTQLTFEQAGAGTTTIAIETDTLNVNSNKTLVLSGQYAVATAIKKSATTWTLTGDLVPS